MATNVATLTAKLQADTTNLKRGLSSAESDVKGFGSKTDKMFSGMGKAAIAGAAVVTAAVVGTAVKSVAAFAEFEKGMNEVFTLLPKISDKAMDDMSDQVKDLSKDFGVMPDKVIPALYQALSAGVPKDNVFEFMETATKASIGGAVDLETTVDGITSVVNAYGDEISGAGEASDIMFTAVRLGKTTFDELSTSLFNVNPIAAALGIPFGEVAAGLAAMTAQGIPTSVATTELRQAFVELGKVGSKPFDAFVDATGQTFPDFIEGGGTVEDAFLAMRGKADDMGVGVGDLFGSVEAGMAVIALTSDTGAKAFGDNLDEMTDSAGATEAAFETMDQGLSRSWDRIKAAVSVALIDMGEKLSPFVAQVADWLTKSLPGAIDTMMGWFDSAIGIVQDFVTGAGAIKDFIVGLPGPVKKVTGLLVLLGAALVALYANPILLGLGAVAGLIVTIGGNAREAEDKLRGLVSDLESMGSISLDNIIDAFGQDFIDLARDAGVSITDFQKAITGTDDDAIDFKQTIRDLRRENKDLFDSFQPQVLTDLRKEYQDAIVELERMKKEEGLTEAATIDLTTELDNQARRMNELDKGTGTAADAITDMSDDMGDALDDSATDFGMWEAELGEAAAGMVSDMDAAVQSTVSIFAGAPDQIQISVDEMIANLMSTRAAADEWEAVMLELGNRGMFGLRQALQDGGPEYTASFKALIADGSSAAEAEALLSGSRIEDSLKTGYGDPKLPSPTVLADGGSAISAAQYMANLFARSFKPVATVTVSSSGKVSATGSVASSTIPGGGVQEFAKGGIVTSPTLAMIGEGGEPEAVVPLSKLGGMDGGSTIIVEGDVYGFDDFADKVADANLAESRRGI